MRRVPQNPLLKSRKNLQTKDFQFLCLWHVPLFQSQKPHPQSLKIQVQDSLLAKIPLDEGIRLGGDMGLPSALSSDPIADPFLDIARQIDEMLFS